MFPNQFINVRLQLGARPNVLTVPTVAVQLGSAGSYVYTVNPDQTVHISKVKPGAVSGPDTIIEQGLQEGQKVVIDGLDKLREGAKVKVIDRVAQNNAAAAAAATPGKGKGQRRRNDGSGGTGGNGAPGAKAPDNDSATPAAAPSATPAPASAPAAAH